MADTPLVATPTTATPSAFSGAGLLSDGEQLTASIKSGDWVSGGMAAFSTAADLATMASDPIGSLLGAGLGWLMEHLEPLKGWMDKLTGNASEVQAFAQTWSNMSKQILSAGQDLQRIVGDVTGQKGAAMDSYRDAQQKAAQQVQGAASWADGYSTALGAASQIVSVVHELTRDALSQVVASAITWVAEALFSFGLGIPWVISQVVTKVSSLAQKVGSALKKLLESIKSLQTMFGKLQGLFSKQGSTLDGMLAGGKTTSAAKPTGTFYSVAHEMELQAKDLAQSRKVHFNRANASLDEAIKSDPTFKAGMERMSPGVADRVAQEGGRMNPNPADFIWHHAHPDTVGGRTGVMQLVPTYQHTPGSDFWTTLHPGGRGGFSIWGKK